MAKRLKRNKQQKPLASTSRVSPPRVQEDRADDVLTRFIDEALSLLLHPLLVVVFHIFLVLSTTAVGLPH